MPRRLFDTVRFIDTDQHEEWELVIRAVKQHGYKLITVREPLVIYYVPENRAALSQTSTWRRSLDWALGMKDLLTRKAFSGFCLTVIAQMAASRGRREALLPLLIASFKYGAPTTKQIAAFMFYWGTPVHYRAKLRAKMQAVKIML